MAIVFECIACARAVRAPDGSQGKRGKCPTCGAITIIPAQSTAAVRPPAPPTPTAPPGPTAQERAQLRQAFAVTQPINPAQGPATVARLVGKQPLLADDAWELLKGVDSQNRYRSPLREPFVMALAQQGGAGPARVLLCYCLWRAAEHTPKWSPFPLLAAVGEHVVPDLLRLLGSTTASERKIAVKTLIAMSRRRDAPANLRPRVEKARSGGNAKAAEVIRRWADRAIPIDLSERDARWSW